MSTLLTWETLAPDAQARRRAAPGQLWQCDACGKVAEDRYGMIGRASWGWDESCALNCELVDATAFGVRGLP